MGVQENLAVETHVGAELKEETGMLNQEILGSVSTQSAEGQTQNHTQPSMCPPSLLEMSPTSVTQPISSAPSPTIPERRLSPPMINNSCISESDRGASELRTLTVKLPIPDGYNWRKYGQKQVKSPKGSRSYYRCTYSDCFAKKIECSDHSGHVIEIVNKGMHSHDPPRKNNCSRESRVTLSAGAVLANSVTEHDINSLKDRDEAMLSKEPSLEMPTIPERKRQNSGSFDGDEESQIKREHKKGDLQCPKTLVKPGKKPKFVVHAAGDVGISGDGYRWRKYGQKMVKGNPHPRNYYRCTSAGCPVRKHIETAVDNTSAVIITYKGVHDHDMPVPKKRHGPPSAPLVAAASPASLNNLQLKKTDALQNQVTSTQWSVGKEGELTGETVELGGEKEKAIESARTLLSIGFEIKPC
ncbi:hypothetical protein Tsubulata_036317 [Turnera subulata]|uniref:WRKY domain-containing protein n=1 Tax=Turnera subulata TaxID=218843 RepID=A0A9Q0FA43_9ROSI|nr:hypothetical protein Tsubulata_036317 [Turnera subulata]